MHMYLRALERVASRYAPSRALSFDIVHVFTALQLVEKKGKTSRQALCNGLELGEGTIKTLVKHLKMNGLVQTSNGGTRMTTKGMGICQGLLAAMPAEMSLPKCSVALGRFNYAVLVREFSFAVRTGIEQRDAAIRIGGTGATTLIFREGKFAMPASSQDSLKKDPFVRKMLVENLKPKEDDMIIIGSAESEKTAELAAKNAALLTIFSHEKHH